MNFARFIKCLTIVVVLLINLSACHLEQQEEAEPMFKVTAYASAYETYRFVLNTDGVLTVSSGRGGADFSIATVEKVQSLELSDQQISEMNEILQGIKGIKGDLINAFDAFQVQVQINGEECRFSYGSAPDQNLDRLFSWLIEHSPLEIVYRNGSPVLPIPVVEN